MHTFTIKAIAKIEAVLGVDIIHIEAQKEYVYFKVLVNQEDDLEATALEKSEIFTTTSGLEKNVS